MQSDPTAEYELEAPREFCGERGHTRRPSTLTDFTGLPPGPIANPGLQIDEAALNPTPTDYLYFVALRRRHSCLFEIV